jgi:hypothetical protein
MNVIMSIMSIIPIINRNIKNCNNINMISGDNKQIKIPAIIIIPATIAHIMANVLLYKSKSSLDNCIFIIYTLIIYKFIY